MQQTDGLVRLNLGCGLICPPGWINIDSSWNARFAKHPFFRRALSSIGVLSPEQAQIPWVRTVFIHDVRKPLPFADGSASVVYSSHLLEHLYPEDGRRLIQEAFRALVGGGVLRVVVPDLQAIIQEYLGERPFGPLSGELANVTPADRFNQRLLMRWPSPSTHGVLYRLFLAGWDFHSHKWMYDADSLKALFLSSGFVEVECKECHASRILDIAEVEDKSRILNGIGICVEGIKPVSK
jgi:predicted SAM-dependent methyltransferase